MTTDERDVTAVERLHTAVRNALLDRCEALPDEADFDAEGLADTLTGPIVDMFPAARFETTERDGVRLRRVALAGEWEVDPNAVRAGASLGEQQHAAEHCHNAGRPHLGPCVDAASANAIPHSFVPVQHKGRIQEGCGYFTRINSHEATMCGAPESAHMEPDIDDSDCPSPVNGRCACPAPAPVDESVPHIERY